MNTTATATLSTNQTCTRRFSVGRLLVIACLLITGMHSINAYGQAACTPPTTQATMGNYSNNTAGDNITVNWTRGNGDHILVIGRLSSAVLSNPASGIFYTADLNFGTGTQVGTGNFVVYNGTGTSVPVTGLTPGANYTFSCYEYNTADACYKTPGSALEMKAGYCIPAQPASYPSGYYISNINTTEGLTNFTNNSGIEIAGYGNYSSTRLASQVQNYPITLSATSAGDGMTYKVFVDYNDNGLFTDAGELVLQMERWNTPGVVSGIFTIPGTAAAGTHRMRVKAQYYGVTQSVDPCEELPYGETEDYALTVVAGCAQPTIQATAESFANNTAFDAVNLNWTRGNGTGGVLVVGRLTSNVLSLPTGGISYIANTVFTSGTQIGNGNFVVYNGTGTSVDITGLTQGVSYTFTCYEYNNPGICFKVPGAALELYAGYCVPPPSINYGYNNFNIHISNVQTSGGIINFTNATGLGVNAYADYSSIKIVSQVQNFPITISTTETVNAMKENVYVDYNDNGVFTDPGELVLQMGVNCVCPASGSFTIPATAPAGTHRMRVRGEVFADGYPTGPCTQLQYGETEDYALTVIAACTQPTMQATIGAYTNIFAGTGITVNWTRGNGTGGVCVVGRLSSSVAVDPKERISYIANPIFGSGSNIGSGNFVVYNGTGTSADITGLTGGANYTFTCYEYDIASTCFKTPGSGLAVIAGGYCTPAQSAWYNSAGFFISNINTTGGITNFTNSTVIEPAAYGFYGSTKIVSQAQSSPITIHALNGGFGSSGMAYNVYVDYNDNGIFTDPGELVLQMGQAARSTVSGSFSIPANAPPGTHRMRVRGEIFENGYPTGPCTQLQYGETEDYGLTVTVGCNPPTTQTTIGSYTNTIPSGNSVTVNWTRGNGTAGLLVVGRLTSTLPTDPTGGQSYNGMTLFGSGSQTAAGNFVVYNGSGNTVTVTGLSPATGYTFTCYEYDAASTCYKTPGSGLSFTSGGYCTPAQSINYSYGMAINKVNTTGGILNFSNNTGIETASYGDYSSTQIASQHQNSQITINTTNNSYGMYYNVYVDYNDNRVFTDPGELVLQMGNTSPGTVSGSFIIPGFAATGTHTMRVKAEFFNTGYPTNPCTQLQFGETEDYGLTVLPPCTPPIPARQRSEAIQIIQLVIALRLTGQEAMERAPCW